MERSWNLCKKSVLPKKEPFDTIWSCFSNAYIQSARKNNNKNSALAVSVKSHQLENYSKVTKFKTFWCIFCQQTLVTLNHIFWSFAVNWKKFKFSNSAVQQHTSWVIALWWLSVSLWRICITFVWPRSTFASIKLCQASSHYLSKLDFCNSPVWNWENLGSHCAF